MDTTSDQPESPSTPFDISAVESDLADVEVALARLDAGTYWTCETTGQPLPEQLLNERPTARRLPQR